MPIFNRQIPEYDTSEAESESVFDKLRAALFDLLSRLKGKVK